MAIHKWAENERPRERLITYGAANLSDAELLAILLRTGVAGKSAVELARDLITSAGNLRALLELPYRDFIDMHGMGPAKYVQLQAALEVCKRVLYETMSRDISLQGSVATREFLRLKLQDKPYEVFSVVFLDARHQVITYKELFRGTINGATVPPREVVKEALQYNAASVIIAHNHPSGVAEPSIADKAITERLQHALALLDIHLLDHIIVGHSQCMSFAERGLLQ
ncbi:MAG: RadC family protein [Arenicella sp.]